MLLPLLLLGQLQQEISAFKNNLSKSAAFISQAKSSSSWGRMWERGNNKPLATVGHCPDSSFSSIISMSGSGGGGQPIYIIGQSTYRGPVSQAVASLTNWPLITTTEGIEALETTLKSKGPQVVVVVEEKVLSDPAGMSYLQSQAVVVNLVEQQSYSAPVSGDAAAKASRFDVAVGQDVPIEEVAQAVVRSAHLSGGFGDGKSDADLHIDLGPNTFFLSLTYGDVRECLPVLEGLERGVDALELRVDLLQDTSPWSVLRQVAILKRASKLPIIFTVRSKDQCGAFPNNPTAVFALLHLGLRAGVEVLDVEANWDRPTRDALLDEAWRKYRGTTRLLGSYHVVGRLTTDEDAKRIFQECYHDGRVDAVKVVLTAMNVRDSFRVHEIAATAGIPPSCPKIALCLGEVGKLSRVLNPRYTPVTSKLLPSVAAPGQLTAEEIMRLRKELGMVPSASFCLLGHPISKSPSPAMHNAAFAHCLLPHVYGLCETEDVEDFRAICRAPTFGGASVTIPHKQSVMPLLDRIEPSAQGIGAVNTVVVEEDEITGKVLLVGHNTDWKGIVKPVQRRLREAGREIISAETGQPRVALVIGGGGTALAAAYGMTSLGLRLLFYNRTPSRAKEVADRFGGQVLTALSPEAIEAATGQPHIDVVISTIPALAEFTLPPEFLQSKPVIMDVVYRPAETPLLAQAKAAGCPFIQGAEMLIGQGIEQFQLWTKRKAPKDIMAAAVFQTVEKLEGSSGAR